jgi:hypothetical protein
MNVWRWFGFFLFVAAVTCFVGTRLPAHAGDKGKDKDKDKEEKKVQPEKGGGAEELKFTAFGEKMPPFYQEVDTNTTQTLNVMGQDVKQVQKQTFYIKWTPIKPDSDKEFKVEQQIVGVKMDIDIGGNKINFDSSVPPDKQPKNPMTDFFNALMKQKLTFTLGSDMSIKKIDGREEFISKLAETNPAIKTLLDTIMSKEALQKMAEPTWWAVPSPGHDLKTAWERPSKLELGPIGTYETKFKFTYDGKSGKLDKIKIDATLNYTKPDKDKTGLPFTIKEANLSGKSTSGEALFDREKGRIEKSNLDMKLEGKLTIEVGAMSTEISLNQTQSSTVKTADKLEELQKK